MHRRPRFRESSPAMPRRYESLDGLRGIAAIAVVLFHINWSNHVTETQLVRHTYLFVDLFFVLSGFVLARAYGDAIQTLRHAAGFLTLRFFRIYPLHIAVLLVFVLYEVAKLVAAKFGLMLHPFGDATPAWTLAPNLLLVESLTFLDPPTWNVPSWSISCEAVTYVVFAAVVCAGTFKARHIVLWASAAAAVLYAVVLHFKGSLFALVDYGLLRCLAGFCVGVAVSKIPDAALAKLPAAIHHAAVLALVAATMAVFSLSRGLADVLAVPLFALLILLLQADRGLPARVLTSAPVAYLGRISYSIYMVHWLPLVLAAAALKHAVGESAMYEGAYFAMYRVDRWSGDLGVVLMLMLVVLIASITYRSVEAPWRSFGRAAASPARPGMVARAA
jgi:peptidoglycan/LPS O-acetylase OafA/YrhL